MDTPDSPLIKGQRSTFLALLLKPHLVSFTLCVLLTLSNTASFGLSLSFVLPAVEATFQESGISSTTLNQATGTNFSQGLSEIIHTAVPDFPKQLVPLALLFAAIVLNAIVNFISTVANAHLTAKLTTDCRSVVFRKIRDISFKEFTKEPHGFFIQLLVTETRSTYRLLKNILNFSKTTLNLICCIWVLGLLSWRLTLVAIAGVLVTGLTSSFFGKTVKRLSSEALTARLSLTERVQNSIAGMKQGRLLNATQVLEEGLQSTSATSELQAFKVTLFQSLQPLNSKLTGTFTALFVIYIGITQPVFPNTIASGPALVTFLIILARTAEPLSVLSEGFTRIISSLPPVDKLCQWYFMKSDSPAKAAGTSVSFSNALTFRNVDFSYTLETPIVENFNLEIPKGIYLGIMGPSGIGKSTCLNLLTKLLHPTAGDIYLDTTPYKNLCPKDIRNKISMLSQDFYIFDGSIRSNFTLASPHATDDQIWNALERAGLNDFVLKLPQGLESSLGQNGGTLSGGQRQRFGLAITFLRDTDIIILDEGLSAVDKRTEEHVLASLREMHKQGKTIISSAHKLSTLADADIIYQFHQRGSLTMIDGKSA